MDPLSADKCSYPRRIFLSYGHDEHFNFAVRLRADLMVRGHEVWFDGDRIKAGADWEHFIERGLDWVSRENNGLMVLIMTPHSVRRPDGFCLNELAGALARKLPILPIMLVPCEPPLSICRIQWLDMTDCVPIASREGDYNARLLHLIKVLEGDSAGSDGDRSHLFGMLKPLAFDAEVQYSLNRFIGRSWVFDEIGRWLDDEKASRLFWISGAPGVGKTAISAWLCMHQPEIAAFHFCRYDSMQKRDSRRAVTSIAYQLSTQLPEFEKRLSRVKLDDIADLDAKTLFDQLIVQPLSANYPRPAGNIVILIDGLDEATGNGKNELASLIASELERCPRWLRIVVTSRPDPEILRQLQAYVPFTIDISDRKNEDDLREYLVSELGRLMGEIPVGTVDAIIDKSGGMFLYSKWVVAELESGRMSLDTLNDFPKGLGGIYLKFFERQFPKPEEWESRIRPALEVIAVVQEPINLKILSSLLKWDPHEERRFKESLGSLFSFDGEIKPFHKSLMEWLTDESKMDTYFISEDEGHRIVAENGWNLFRAGRLTSYLISYLPYHLSRVDRWDELGELLGDLAFFRKAWEKDKYRLLSLWGFLEENSPLRISKVYNSHELLTRYKEDKELMAVAELLSKAGNTTESTTILEYLVGLYRKNNDIRGLSVAMYPLVRIIVGANNLKTATSLADEHERICRTLNDTGNLIKALTNQVTINIINGNYDKAMTALGEIEKLTRESGDIQGQIWSLKLQGFIYIDYHEYARALSLLELEEKLDREYGYMDLLAACLIGQGEIKRFTEDYDGAMALYDEAMGISRSIGNKVVMVVCILNNGLIDQARGRLDEALTLYQSAGKISREYGFLDMIGNALDGQGMILGLKGQAEKALAFHKEAEAIFRTLGNKRLLAESIGFQAQTHEYIGDLDQALRLLKEQEGIYRESGLEIALQECLGRQEKIQKKADR